MKNLNRKNVLKTLAVIGIALFSKGVALQASSDFTNVNPTDQQIVNEINRVKRENGVGGQVVLDNTFKDIACQQARQHNHTFMDHTRVVNGITKTTSYNNYGEDEQDFSSNVLGHTYYKAANAINDFWTEKHSLTGNSHRISLSKKFDGVSVCSIKGAMALNFITYTNNKPAPVAKHAPVAHKAAPVAHKSAPVAPKATPVAHKAVSAPVVSVSHKSAVEVKPASITSKTEVVKSAPVAHKSEVAPVSHKIAIAKPEIKPVIKESQETKGKIEDKKSNEKINKIEEAPKADDQDEVIDQKMFFGYPWENEITIEDSKIVDQKNDMIKRNFYLAVVVGVVSALGFFIYIKRK